MASSTGHWTTAPPLAEPDRRRPGATGTPITLADGATWLLASLRFAADRDGGSFSHPDLDAEIDRLFEASTLEGEVALADVFLVARSLLRANYHLDDAEFAELASLGAEPERLAFASAVLDAVFGGGSDGEPRARGYTDWARASLLANGIAASAIRPEDLTHILAILVATGRTIPASRFVDACRMVEERAHLEAIV